jgi:hypothetical protein
MEQLTYEWLAELVDREPTREEMERLSGDPELKDALNALRAQTEALGQLPRMMPPRGDWEELEARLMSEGLIRRNRPSWLPGGAMASGWTRAVAAAVIFLVGGVTGSAMSGPGSPVARGSLEAELSQVGSVGEAAEFVQRAEEQYINSLLRYRQLAARAGQDVPRNDRDRAQALDLLVQASQSALRAAPHDPFINGILVNALAERQAVTRDSSDDDNWF